jgi:hypothetical protein
MSVGPVRVVFLPCRDRRYRRPVHGGRRRSTVPHGSGCVRAGNTTLCPAALMPRWKVVLLRQPLSLTRRSHPLACWSICCMGDVGFRGAGTSPALRGARDAFDCAAQHQRAALNGALVDTNGRRLEWQVLHPASVRDRDRAPSVLKASRARFPCIRKVFADSIYFGERVAKAIVIAAEIVHRLCLIRSASRCCRVAWWSSGSWPGAGCKGFRGNDRIRNCLPLWRLGYAVDPTRRMFGSRFDSDFGVKNCRQQSRLASN